MLPILAPLYEVLLHLDASWFKVGSIKIVVSYEHCHHFHILVVLGLLKFVKLDH